MVKLVHVTTVAQTLRFFEGQAAYLRQRSFDVQAASSPEDLDRFGESLAVEIHAVPMTRAITPCRDLVSLWRLWRLFRSIRPDIVHSHTPKAGLLGTIAARAARVPVVFLSVFGLPQMTKRGIIHTLLDTTTRLACGLAHRVWCDSPTIRDHVIREGLCAADKVVVMGHGSVNGVDTQRVFAPHRFGPTTRAAIRERYGIPPEATVLGYVGRIVGDKGMHELTMAWKMLRECYTDLHLLMIGSFESKDPLVPDDERLLRSDPRIHLTGHCLDMPPLYAAMDIFVMPSYREGFGVANLEAAAMELPVVSTRIPGCVDSVDDGVTGMLVPPRDAQALAAATRAYLDDPALRRQHGRAGRERAARCFRQELIWEALFHEYSRSLERTGVVSGSHDLMQESGRAVRGCYARCGKRMLDLGLSILLLFLLSPLLVVVALLVRAKLGTPVLFRQQRPGLQGEPFTIFKFRTMPDMRDERGALLPDSERLTPFGRFLRSTSLDELPELYNVLQGEMSLVGPRPLLMRYLDRYTPEQARRHEVKPGITGWAQVNGRNAITWEQKFALDLWYVEHRSLWLDLWILCRTVLNVITRVGISQPGQATMEEFMGERNDR